MSSMLLTPALIAAELAKRVLGQDEAVREMAVAVAKKLAGLRAGNVLLIGSSGTGKTTLMRAVEEVLAADPRSVGRSTLVRVHANVLADESEQGRSGEAVLSRLLEAARRRLGSLAPREALLEGVVHGIVFVDEVDKIRANVGGEVNVRGIRAQEALLTLVENEAVPFALPEWSGGGLVSVDTRDLLFVCAGAFEGLYDAVYDRVTVGEDRGALRAVTVLEGQTVREELPFRLRDWLRPRDLFDYGLTPQFLSRFDSVVLLDELDVDSLERIFEQAVDSRLRQTRDYLAALGLELELTPAARRRIAVEAARQPRLGARALAEVFGRVIREIEFDPPRYAQEGRLRLDEEAVARRLEPTPAGEPGAVEAGGGWRG